MPNNYFQFKQFTVHQDKCAMKVCTDACLFGSLSPALPAGPLRLLDIGTGTGLLALMQAQKYPRAIIDAVEIDGDAARQAAENFESSPWGSRLKVHHTPIQEFNGAAGYDFIISNPPFFENELKSGDTKRNLALHGEALGFPALILSINRLLKEDGSFGVLLPYHRTGYFDQLAFKQHFHLSQKILVKQSPAHHYFRSILFLTRSESRVVEKEVIIQDEAKQYTPAFKELLGDYYLHL